jgi:hypothetical protein
VRYVEKKGRHDKVSENQLAKACSFHGPNMA